MFTAYLEKRGKSPKGTWPKQGPDVYFAVQLVPEGVKPLKNLNKKSAKKRGIEIVYCGDGYSKNTGPQSMYSAALNRALDIVARVNELKELIV